MARSAPESPIEDVFGALANGDDHVEAPADVPAEVTKYIRELLTIANETRNLKSVTFTVDPHINAICERIANGVHNDDIVHVLPSESHVTAMEYIKGKFGLKTSATTTPASPVLKTAFLAMASRDVRVQRRLLMPGTAPAQQTPRIRRGSDDVTNTTKTEGCMQDVAI